VRVAVDIGKALIFKDERGRISVSIGVEEEKWNAYKLVTVEVNPDVTSQELHSFLSVLGLPTTLVASRSEDIENENVARLAQALYPAETSLLPAPEDAIRYVIGKGETAVKKIKQREEGMHLKDIGNGRMEYVDPMAVNEFWLSGGRGFAATLGHNGITLDPIEIYQQGGFSKVQEIKAAAQTLTYVLKGGMMSSMNRFELGIIGAGNSPEENVATGSANQVFTRPLTDNQFDTEHDWASYAIEGNILLLMDASLAERLPYGYPSDRAGLRNPRHMGKTVRMAQKEFPELGLHGSRMQERQRLEEICGAQRRSDKTLPTAEVMFADLIGSDYIYGAVVHTEKDKRAVIEVLNKNGIDNIQGKPLKDVLFVGNLNKKMIKPIFKEI